MIHFHSLTTLFISLLSFALPLALPFSHDLCINSRQSGYFKFTDAIVLRKKSALTVAEKDVDEINAQIGIGVGVGVGVSVSGERSDVARRLKKIQKRRESPHSQHWYKEKQKHISKNQKRVMRRLWPSYGVDLEYAQKLNITSLFNKNDNEVPNCTSTSSSCHNPNQLYYVVVDIGFGTGESIYYMANKSTYNKEKKVFLGVELMRSGLSSALCKLEKGQIFNDTVRLIRSDATILLKNHLYDASLDEICIYFPDPWMGDRDTERRIVRPQTLHLFTEKLKINGLLRICTDVREYATHVVDVIDIFNSQCGRCRFQLGRSACHEAGVDVPEYRGLTKYELRAAEREAENITACNEGGTKEMKTANIDNNKGNLVWDFEYRLIQR